MQASVGPRVVDLLKEAPPHAWSVVYAPLRAPRTCVFLHPVRVAKGNCCPEGRERLHTLPRFPGGSEAPGVATGPGRRSGAVAPFLHTHEVTVRPKAPTRPLRRDAQANRVDRDR